MEVINKMNSLEKLEKEKEKLEKELKTQEDKNKKIKALRGLKYSLRFMQLVTPYVVVAGIGLGAFNALGITPFIRDEHKKCLETETQFDSIGNIRYEEQYDNYKNAIASITYYGEWKKDDDGLYKRDIKKYANKKIDNDTIKEIVEKKDINSLEEIFGDPIARSVEKKNNITEDELNKKAYLQATTYSKDKDDFIIVTEDLATNIGTTILFLVVLLLLEVGTLSFREQFTSFDFDYAISDIKARHRLIDTDELYGKLEDKKSEIEKLARQKTKK